VRNPLPNFNSTAFHLLVPGCELQHFFLDTNRGTADPQEGVRRLSYWCK